MNFFFSLFKVIGYAFAGRLHFPRNRVGKEFMMEGEKWIIFREAVVDPGKDQPEKPGAIFIPRFHVAGMSLSQNIAFSLLPMCLILGLPGFRSKVWLYHPQNGDFAGYYEWDAVENADNYSHSVAASFMINRSMPGSVSFKVVPMPG